MAGPPRVLVDSIVQSLNERPYEWVNKFTFHEASGVQILCDDNPGTVSIFITNSSNTGMVEYGSLLFLVGFFIPWRWRILNAVHNARKAAEPARRSARQADVDRACRILGGASA